MNVTHGVDFEPFVEFPANPFDAARIYLGVLAYPERGAGQPDGLGSAFGAALWEYVVWHGRKAKGLRDIRKLFGDPQFSPPRKRDFEGALNRGRRRIQRRVAAYDIVGNRMVNGFLNALMEANRLTRAGRAQEAYDGGVGAKYAPIRAEIWAKKTPSSRRIVHRDLDRWSERFGLNRTGRPADPMQKGKDLIRRGYLESRPVIHLAHGINQIIADMGPSLIGWQKADWLLVLLWNADQWVWKAIDYAIAWRSISHSHHLQGLAPEQMIELSAPKKA